MNCNDVRRHWMLYLDSEGAPELHFRIQEHLEMCATCAQWYARQQRFERAVAKRLATTRATPELWDRVLSRVRDQPMAPSRRHWLLTAGACAAGIAVAAAVLLAVLVLNRLYTQRAGPELTRLVADEHAKVLQGEVQPEFISTSDEEVDRYLKTKLAFPVHCPPRKDVAFDVEGAGICRIKDERAAIIVGQVDRKRVSILVFEDASVGAFPDERDHLTQGGGRHCRREGNMQVIAGVVAGNLVVIVGEISTEKLEKLLNAYGTYPEG